MDKEENKKTVMLALPNTKWFNLRPWHLFPYILGLFTEVLKEKYNIVILDANIDNLSFNQVKERILNCNPDYFCITCLSLEYNKGFKKMVSIVKDSSPKTIVIAGGIYPTLLPEHFLDDVNFDYIIMGEGEYRLPRLLNYLENEINSIKDIDGLVYHHNGKRIIQQVKNYIKDLDKLPMPRYENINLNKYINKVNKYSHYLYPRKLPYACIISSRGCPFNCIYCSSKAISGSTIRYRSAESVLAEIDFLVSKYGVKELIFLDDNLYLDRQRINKILNGLIKRNYDLIWKSINAATYALDNELLELMKESGCYQITLAIESGTQEVLKIMRKPLKLSKVKGIVEKAKLLNFELTGLFIIGTPGETWLQIRKTIKFAESLDLDYVSFNIATPLPKTELYEICKRNGFIPNDFDFRDFSGFGRAVITTDEFTGRELEILRSFEWDRINFRNEEQEVKIAKMNGITLKELREWRIRTRRGIE